MNVWSDYRKHIYDTWGIKTIDTRKEFEELKRSFNLLICTGCSANKKEDGLAYKPSELYLGSKNINFCRVMLSNNYAFGILSDLHALCLEDERYSSYDVHPSQLIEEDFIRLGTNIKNKMISNKYNSLLYYNPSPIMGSPYFKMLSHIDFPVSYFSKLDIVTKKPTLF